MWNKDVKKKTKKITARHYLGDDFTCLNLLRLVGDEERRWTDENIDMVALKHFPNIDKDKALNRPILYSNWLSKVGHQLFPFICWSSCCECSEFATLTLSLLALAGLHPSGTGGVEGLCEGPSESLL